LRTNNYNTNGTVSITTKISERLPKLSIAILLLPILALVLISCKSVGEGSWVTIDNIKDENSQSVYYLIEEKSPFGDLEKYEDSQGYRRICLVLEFAPDSGSGGDATYTAELFDDAAWELCRELVLADEPSYVAASVPTELRSEFGLD